MDAEHGAANVASDLWRQVWASTNWPEGVTWESKFPKSAGGSGIVGTLSSAAGMRSTHYNATLRGRRQAGHGLKMTSQSELPPNMGDPKDTGTPEAEATQKWNDYRKMFMNEIDKQITSGDEHLPWLLQSYELAKEIIAKRMIYPGTMLSMRAVIEDDDELQKVLPLDKRGKKYATVVQIMKDAMEKVMDRMYTKR